MWRSLPAVLRDPRALDVVGALAAAALAELELVASGDIAITKETTAVLILVQTLPLAFRRIVPVPAVAVMLAGDLALVGLSGSNAAMPALSYLSLLVGIYSVATYRPRHVSIPVTLAALAVVIFGVATSNGGIAEIGWIILSLITPFAAAWFVGDHLRTRRIVTDALTARTAQLEREREENAREAVIAERTRIARELHDVVAHSLSVIVVQASAAGRVLDHEPAQARTSLGAIETTARDALAEMRRLLGVLRQDDHDRSLAPQPGLSQLDALLQTMRGAGLPVDLIVEGDASDLPAGLDLSAYRVVQEGLTNALKHANATRATVLIDYRDRALEIEVRDDGVGGPASRDGLGQGLIGMRERVAVYGGTLECGPRRGGGFAVRARFPAPSTG